MKSKVFEFKIVENTSESGETCKAIELPKILKAFAIEYSRITLVCEDGTKIELMESHDYQLHENGGISLFNGLPAISIKSAYIYIHYYGVKDYLYLFPSVTNIQIKQRIALFYEEAENNIESGSFFSYITMCSGIFEGLLIDKLTNLLNEQAPNLFTTNNSNCRRIQRNIQRLTDGSMTYAEVISCSKTYRLISGSEKTKLDKIRDLRNLIHPLKDGDCNFRSQALKYRTLMDKLIVRFL